MKSWDTLKQVHYTQTVLENNVKTKYIYKYKPFHLKMATLGFDSVS